MASCCVLDGDGGGNISGDGTAAIAATGEDSECLSSIRLLETARLPLLPIGRTVSTIFTKQETYQQSAFLRRRCGRSGDDTTTMNNYTTIN